MLKQVKRNKRLNWGESRYARPRKLKILAAQCIVAGIMAQAINQQRNVIFRRHIQPVLAVAEIQSNAMKASIAAIKKLDIPPRVSPGIKST